MNHAWQFLFLNEVKEENQSKICFFSAFIFTRGCMWCTSVYAFHYFMLYIFVGANNSSDTAETKKEIYLLAIKELNNDLYTPSVSSR